MKKLKFQRFAPILCILAGVLFLLPSIFRSAINNSLIGIGMMFIIFGIVLSIKKKPDEPASKKS